MGLDTSSNTSQQVFSVSVFQIIEARRGFGPEERVAKADAFTNQLPVFGF